MSSSVPNVRALALLGGLSAAFGPQTTHAEPTRELYISDPDEVRQGDPVSTTIDAAGRISAGPAIRPLGDGVGRAITAMAPDGDGFLAGTAGGGLLRIDRAGKARSLMKAADKVVTAVLAQGDRRLASVAPKAELFRVDGDKPKSLVKLKAKYVWAMAPAGRRTLLATGEPGQVVALDDKNRTTVWFDSDESHLRALIRHPQRGWIVGGGQKGIVYQLVGNKKARALYDSDFEEVTGFAFDPKRGDLYAAFVSADKTGKPLAERWIGPTKGEKTKPDLSPFKGSEVIRIRPSGQVEVLWRSNTEGAMALRFADDRLYFSTGTAADGRARIYAVDVAQRDALILWARLEPPLAPTMIPGGKGALVVGTAPTGRIFQVGPGRQREATYLSVEQDLARTARVGQVWFDADVPPGARVAVSIRTGNTKKPDDTWSPWSAAVTARDGGAVQVPDARYVQLRAVLRQGKGGSPIVKSMHASIVRHNSAPKIRDVFTLRRGVHLTALPVEQANSKTLSLNARALKELRSPPKRQRQTRVRQRTTAGMMTIAWRVTDADGDDLIYRVEMRRYDGTPSKWVSVADDATEDGFYSFDSRAYPDGRYQFRVTASDRPSNAPRDALFDRHVSEPILIDNRAPKLSGARVTRLSNGRLRVVATAQDAHSRLERSQVSINGGPWLMLPAADGLLDSKSERLQVILANDEWTPHDGAVTAVRIRVADEAGNATSGSAALAPRG